MGARAMRLIFFISCSHPSPIEFFSRTGGVYMAVGALLEMGDGIEMRIDRVFSEWVV